MKGIHIPTIAEIRQGFLRLGLNTAHIIDDFDPLTAFGQVLLDYFGEQHQACGNCDVCADPPELWDGTQAAHHHLAAGLDDEVAQQAAEGGHFDVLVGPGDLPRDLEPLRDREHGAFVVPDGDRQDQALSLIHI